MTLIERTYIKDYQSNFRKLAWITWSRIQITDEAKDIAGEALTKTWENRHKLGGPADIYRYAFSCVRHACINYSARHRRHEPVGDYADEWEDLENNTEKLEAMYQSVKALPKRKRKVILLVLEGLTNDEIAGRMQTTGLTIRQDIFRSVKILKRLLTPIKT